MHPKRIELAALVDEACGLTNQIAAASPNERGDLHQVLSRLATQHLALLAVVQDMATQVYPVAFVAPQPE